MSITLKDKVDQGYEIVIGRHDPRRMYGYFASVRKVNPDDEWDGTCGSWWESGHGDNVLMALGNLVQVLNGAPAPLSLSFLLPGVED